MKEEYDTENLNPRENLYVKEANFCKSQGSEYIVGAIDLLKEILKDDYTSNWNNDKDLLKNVNYIEKNLEQKLIEYIISLDIDRMIEQPIESVDQKTLLSFFEKILQTIKVNYYEDLMLFKYNNNIYLTGWHNLAKECRGKVLNKNTLEIVSYPFDKFFNIDERDEVSKKNVEELIKEAKSVVVAEKVDGSTIAISKYNGKLIITTNGSFQAEQVKIARNMINNKYKDLEKNIKENYTYIFEIIYPSNQIVVDYKGEEAMYLLTIRDNISTRFLSEEDLKKENIGMPLAYKYKFTSLDDFINKQLEPFCNKEGWVFYITLHDKDVLVKLKYIDYLKIHKVVEKVSFKGIYEVFVNDSVDDVISNVINNEYFNNCIKEFEDILVYLENRIRSEVNTIRDSVNAENPDMEFKCILGFIKTEVLKPYIIKGLKCSGYVFNIKDISYKSFVNIIVSLDDEFINSKSIIDILNP